MVCKVVALAMLLPGRSANRAIQMDVESVGLGEGTALRQLLRFPA
jgi:hypothetical protein